MKKYRNVSKTSRLIYFSCLPSATCACICIRVWWGVGGRTRIVTCEWVTLLGGACGKSAFFPYGKKSPQELGWQYGQVSTFSQLSVLIFVREDWPQEDQFVSPGLKILFLSFIEKAVVWRSRKISGVFVEESIIPRTSAVLWQMSHKPQVSKLQLKALVC